MSNNTINEVPLEIYRHFEIDTRDPLGYDVNKLRTISRWALDGTSNMQDAINKIGSLENRTGIPQINKQRYEQVWQTIAIKNHVGNKNGHIRN